MAVPFSDVPEDIVQREIALLLHRMGDLEQALMAYGVDEDVLALNQSLLILLGALRSEFAGDHLDAKNRIRAVVEQLGKLQEL